MRSETSPDLYSNHAWTAADDYLKRVLHSLNEEDAGTGAEEPKGRVHPFPAHHEDVVKFYPLEVYCGQTHGFIVKL